MLIAAWSGPRNLSTAMMYAFAARGDCAVWDEPFYAAYLERTRLAHPMRDEILAAGVTDPAVVAAGCAAPPPDGLRHLYQKHMSQHMLPGFDRTWFARARHVFLIRHPARVLASYDAKRENPALDDIGFRQQAEIFDAVDDPVVIDSADIREAPEPMLRTLCRQLGIDFTPAMLSWPAGGHPDDGVWAAHWYGVVHASTGFAGPEGPLPAVPSRLMPVLEDALPHYERLKVHAIEPMP